MQQNQLDVKLSLNVALSLIPKHCNPEEVKHQAAVGGHIRNNTKSSIKFHDKHDWSGRSKTRYPHTISQRRAGTFVHAADCRGRPDMAGVVYYGRFDSYSNDLDCAFLVAWSVTDQCGCPTPNKVYVEAGSIEDYTEIDWCEIKDKLEASPSTSHYVDKSTGLEVFAKITEGNNAALTATFNNSA